MIGYFEANQHAFWFAVGFVLLAIEIGFLGLASGIVLFSGLGALLTGVLIWLGWLPQTWLAGIASFGISSFLSAVILWRPLLRFQNQDVPAKDNSSDLIGYEFRLQQPLNTTDHGKTQYSGIEWRVEIDARSGLTSLDSGSQVVVASVDAGVFRVKPADRQAPGK